MTRDFISRTSAGSIAHVTMLAKQGILTEAEMTEIRNGLEGILADVEAGRLEIDPTAEDIHSFVEATLIERVGDVERSCIPAEAETIRLLWT